MAETRDGAGTVAMWAKQPFEQEDSHPLRPRSHSAAKKSLERWRRPLGTRRYADRRGLPIREQRCVLSGLQAQSFPDEHGRLLYEEIVRLLTEGGEILPEAGSLPSTVFRMTEQEAQDVAAKIIELAGYYGQDDLV